MSEPKPEGVGTFSLEGKVAAVVGASSGLGARFAQALAAAGARVVIGARREERLAGVASSIAEAGGEALPVACDVTRDGDCEALVERAREAFGGLDVMVANAGVAPHQDPGEVELPGAFSDVVDVNLTGAYRCARAAYEPMSSAVGGGSIILTSSISGLVAGDGPDTPSYVSSKAALVGLAKELAVRWAPTAVRVNAIAPGWFRTEMTEADLGSEAGLAFVVERTPMGRPGGVEELDGALLFLASGASTYVTGQTIAVDGGWVAR